MSEQSQTPNDNNPHKDVETLKPQLGKTIEELTYRRNMTKIEGRITSEWFFGQSKSQH